MSTGAILRLGSVKDVGRFQAHLQGLHVQIPCDSTILTGAQSPLRMSLVRGRFKIGNRIAVQPMEGWDATTDGVPSENTIRRWKRFGRTGGKLIWGGEAVAVCHEGRANPNQLLASPRTQRQLGQLRSVLRHEHIQTTGSDDGLLIGLQLTHSGRYCRPNEHTRPEPRILYRHPLLDRRLKLPVDYPLLTDSEIEAIIEDFHRAARMAWELGFDFVDIKHCHGYLGHEFLSAHTRPGRYGGTFEGRTRFLREVVQGIRSLAPGLQIGVRLSAIDTLPFQNPKQSHDEKAATGVPETCIDLLPYRWGFGVNPEDPRDTDLSEPEKFLSLLEQLGILLVNITAGSPYYNPHIQRPALYPPSDGYLPPEDPLVGVARQMAATRELKRRFQNLIIVGSAYTYLQDFLPHVAQAALSEGWVDFVGVGRMVLTYPEFLWDASEGNNIHRKRVCRTFSDCTTAPRNGLPSGCYPLDEFYKDSDWGIGLGFSNNPDQTFGGSQSYDTGSAMTVEELLKRQRLRRKVQGIAAALLPYEPDGKVAIDAFAQQLISTHRAGLMNAVNMDTGYVNYLTEGEKQEVLKWTRRTLGPGVPFIAGAYIENQSAGDIVALYRQQMEAIVRFDGIPILFQTARLRGQAPKTIAQIYRDAVRGFPHVLAFELGPMFAANGQIYDLETVQRLMDIPEIEGMKHSSLSRLAELQRLMLRDTHRPDFRIYTGNDLGINMIEYGSDYLLGLAAFAPEKFAERDRLWQAGDPEYYALSDALQHLGNVAFRAPVPAYKHSAAVFLHLIGRIPSDRTHPENLRRQSWESEILTDCVRRLSLL